MGCWRCRDADDAGRKHGSCPAACPFRGDCWPAGGRPSCLTCVRDAPAWGCSGREGGCRAGLSARLTPVLHQAGAIFRSRAACLHAGSVPECPGRPQKAKKPSMRRASLFPIADRLPGLSSGGRTVMSATGHACRTVGRRGLMGARIGRKGPLVLMRERPLPSMLVSSVAGLKPGPKRQPFLLPCGRRCGGRRR